MKDNKLKPGTLATSEPPVSKPPAIKPEHRDLRDVGCYAIDKTVDTIKDGLRHMESEKPGTGRKLAGVSATGVGLTMTGIGIYLLVS